MLDYVLAHTAKFLEDMPKSVRKKKGQFFTSKETAIFMASLFDFSKTGTHVEILDPGAGTGILSAALMDRIIFEHKIQSVSLTCYENDPTVLSVLSANLQYIKEQSPIAFSFNLIEDDYILSQANDFEGNLFANSTPKKYDLIIGNPPYLRVARSNEAAMSMPDVVHGAPNMYFLFASMSLFNLKPECEMVYIIPRSWTSGEYFKAFRYYFLQKGKLEQLHLFVSRDKVFSQEQVLQETMIVKLKKTQRTPDVVKISSTQTSDDFHDITELNVPYDAVVSGENMYVYLPTSDADVDAIRMINCYTHTFPEVGLKMHTGIVVDFRQREELRKGPGEHTVPLFYSQHIKNGRVSHDPTDKEYEWITDLKPGLIQKNQNYVFCKRFTAKEERRRLQCGIYLSKDFPDYQYIGTQNKINYVNRLDDEEMSIPLTFGIYALLNSTLFDMFYRILNGSTQVNSTEINHIPVPPIEKIEEIGQRLLGSGSLSTKTCDEILKGVAYYG